MSDKTELDALVDVTGFRGTPEQLINALSEMVRREPRQMQGAILRAALSALTAANAKEAHRHTHELACHVGATELCDYHKGESHD